MSTSPTFWPDVSEESGPQTHFALTIAQNALQDHDRALITLNDKIAALQAGSSSGGSSSGGSSSGGSSGGGTTPTTPTLGAVTVVTDPTYITQTANYGGIIVFNNATGVAVTLNFAVTAPWYATFENIGLGAVTITPQSGVINLFPSIILETNTGCVIYFDGTNWWAFTVPPSLVLETDGAVNGNQGLLNLVAGTNINLTDDGAGNVTIDATGGGGGASRGPLQSNANGWWWVWSDGVIEQFGQVTVAPTSTNLASGLATYPTAFSTTVMNFELTLVGLPRAASAEMAMVQASTVGLTTAGLNLQCSVPTGGGGVTFDQAVVVNWRAVGI